jgi:serine/threonine protein kinase
MLVLPGPLYVIIELAEYGCLLDFLHKHQMYSFSHREKISILSEQEKTKFGLDVAKGLEHLTRHKVRNS